MKQRFRSVVENNPYSLSRSHKKTDIDRMTTKNRKFNVAGIGHYSTDFEEGELIYFELEPNNPHDKNAIKVLNESFEQIGYVPRDSAIEFQSFFAGKYPHYCARIVEIWEGREGDDMPKVLAHFASILNELPYAQQQLINSATTNPTNLQKTKLPVIVNWIIITFLVFVLYLLWSVLSKWFGGHIVSTLITLAIGYFSLDAFLDWAIESPKN